nr:Chain C, Nonamer peptide: LEU-SER-SER-PRO-VAL-THR-LYS-SER-TRP [synthetic construct]5VVP_C Chain C, LEU-SER-SER-PRO-VAL-THR-LYS-SER-TRP [synthetic construct]5VWH_C Chain C, Nonamer peptide: LEU-SER-SER-PRO-VAL-THR-LYS-SER-TRP [synthetic construct]
LSSPVTKSW